MKLTSVFASIAALVFLTACGSGETTAGSTSKPDGVATFEVGEPAEVEAPNGVDRATWTLRDVSRRATPRDEYSYNMFRSKESDKYAVLDFNVEVTGGEWWVDPWHMEAVPDADTGTPEYAASSGMTMDDRNALYEGHVPAGKHVEGEVYFDMPPGAYTVTLSAGNVDGYEPVASWHITV